MKKVTAIGLILIMSFQCFYKLGVITYFHMNRDYIAEVLCINKEEPMTMCNGQCFLERNVGFATDANAEEQTPPMGKRIIDFPSFIVSENFSQPSVVMLIEHGNSKYFTSISSGHSPAPFHPPALVS